MSIDAYQDSENSRDLTDKGPQFKQKPLSRTNLHAHPITQFSRWYKEAEQQVRYPNQVSIGTVSAEGQPVVRTVLLKGFDDQGFRFFTNYQSRKATHLNLNPKISMCIYWEKLERQIIILGEITKLSDKESDDYFATRGKGSQIGAHVSSQSQVVKSRKILESQFTKLPFYLSETHWQPLGNRSISTLIF